MGTSSEKTFHVVAFDDAIVQLPPEIALGHHQGDDPDLVERRVVPRADSAGWLWQAPGVADIEIGAAWLEGFEAATRIWRDLAQEHLIALDVHVHT
jgi:hypothetical protein